MSTDEKESEVKKEKPRIYFKRIKFNDGTDLSLKKNSIIVFTGANNSGKSQVLKDIESCLDETNDKPPVIVKERECDYLGTIDEKTFLEEHFIVNNQGKYQPLEAMELAVPESVLINNWKNQKLYNNLYKLFVNRLSTEIRLTSSNALERNKRPEKHPIYKLNKNEKIAQKISEYFRQAFGVDLVINCNEMQTIPLHVGQAPGKKEFTMDRQDEYYRQVAKLPKLQEQGDGMRSFASILLNTFTSDYSITLIDEPEAFLHPPQARVLGKMLAQNNPDNRQLIISTHSEDFLQGLLDADNENVTVIRINREGNTNKMNVLKNGKIKELWGNPLLRYSNILSGLFHSKVVVCESDYDCLFYHAILNAIYEHKNEIAPDVLFTHCGGKSRIKDVVAALKAVDVPVVAITDFDLLNSSQNFKPLMATFGVEWKTSLATDMKTIYDSMNAKSSNGIDWWKVVKETGKAGFTGDEPAAYEKVEKVCRSVGLFVVPVGEIECFDKTVSKKKKDWVYYVLENYDLKIEPKLEEARKFVQTVADFKVSDTSVTNG